MLTNILPPEQPRPYYGEGKFYREAFYGNEWLINNYLLQKFGVTIIGPEFTTLTKPINIKEIQKACLRDLLEEWKPKLKQTSWLNNPHYQSYLTLNLCRIFG